MRLIDADALKEEFSKHEDNKGYLIGDWEDYIDNAPTVTVDYDTNFYYCNLGQCNCGQVLPQGKWLHDNKYLDCRCSVCNGEALGSGDYPELSRYCPHCGAQMEVENNGKETTI